MGDLVSRGGRLLAACVTILGATTVGGCGNKADAVQNIEANKANAANAGVNGTPQSSKPSKPPVDPTK